ncbi:MAG: IS6 family transposase [Euryarchaeota archaeon]|nr:IS6 family transposase [Euryarchaeota archaeon]
MVYCPSCVSSNIRKYGTDSARNQKYICTGCRKQFTQKTGTPYCGMRYPEKVVSYALNLHFRHKMPLRQVKSHLGEKGIAVSHVAVHGWVKKFGPTFSQLYMRFREYNRRWHLDMNPSRLNGRFQNLWIVYDANGIPVAVRVAQRRTSAAGEVLVDALRLTGFRPEAIFTNVEGIQEEIRRFHAGELQ